MAGSTHWAGQRRFFYSPYSSYSSFAGNYLFISLSILQKQDWMRTYIMSEIPEESHNDFVDFERITSFKLPLLKVGAENFFKYAEDEARKEYDDFCQRASSWLDDYALFAAVAEDYNNFNWITWDHGIRTRQPGALKEWRAKLKDQVDFHKFVQYMFYKQWDALKSYANQQGVKIIGDIPIYVTFDSADAWANPGIFQLEPDTLLPSTVAGVPPDYFSDTGQLWGNPLYQWYENGKLKGETLVWWTERFKHMLAHFDLVRIDHFRGFESYWSVSREEKTAVNGKWEKGPGAPFFKEIKAALGKGAASLPLIAEDLG